MANEILTEIIGNRNIALKGIGRAFYENGYPVSMSVQDLKEKGIETSILHIADECLKNGWSPKTTYTKLCEDFQDTYGNEYNLPLLKKFCYADYETQREMLFEYLFGTPSNDVKNDVIKGKDTIATDWIRSKYSLK